MQKEISVVHPGCRVISVIRCVCHGQIEPFICLGCCSLGVMIWEFVMEDPWRSSCWIGRLVLMSWLFKLSAIAALLANMMWVALRPTHWNFQRHLNIMRPHLFVFSPDCCSLKELLNMQTQQPRNSHRSNTVSKETSRRKRWLELWSIAVVQETSALRLQVSNPGPLDKLELIALSVGRQKPLNHAKLMPRGF